MDVKAGLDTLDMAAMREGLALRRAPRVYLPKNGKGHTPMLSRAELIKLERAREEASNQTATGQPLYHNWLEWEAQRLAARWGCSFKAQTRQETRRVAACSCASLPKASNGRVFHGATAGVTGSIGSVPRREAVERTVDAGRISHGL